MLHLTCGVKIIGHSMNKLYYMAGTKLDFMYLVEIHQMLQNKFIQQLH